MDARNKQDRILDALEALLLERGVAALTLEAVAARAEVSKGGLLHYYRSKEALLAGLVTRLAARVDVDLAPPGSGAVSMIGTYLASSTAADSDLPLYRSLVAALRGSAGGQDEVSRSLRAVFTVVTERLHAEIDDPVLAEIVRLVGDGLLFADLTGMPRPAPELLDRVVAALLDRVPVR